MRFRFTRDAEIEVVTRYDEELDKAETEDEFFKSGDEVDCDLLSSTSDRISVQFADGSCCYGLQRDCIEILCLDDDEVLDDQVILGA